MKLLWAVFLFVIPIATQANVHSPRRLQGESFRSAYLRNLIAPSVSDTPRDLDGPAITPWSAQGEFGALPLAQVPAVESYSMVTEMFEKIRDVRAWQWNEMPGFLRRIPWLYGDDGCYLRAEMAAQLYRRWGYPVPFELFTFGDLTASTYYGTTSWWFHVAPIVRAGNEFYVIDPALEPKRPLKLSEWALKMMPDMGQAKYAICQPDAVDPNDDCTETESHWDSNDQEAELQKYLGLEWQTLEAYLNSPPSALLGEHPPWVQ